MKFLKIAGVLLGLIVLAFLALGMLVTEFDYEGSVNVKASAEKSWKVFHDTTMQAKWMEGFKSFKLEEGTNMEPGAIYTLKIDDGSKVYVMKERIVAVNAPASVTYALTNEVMTSDYTFTFNESGDGTTKIESHFKVMGKNLLWRSVLFLSKSYFTSSNQQQLESLKKVIEEQP